MKRLKKIAWLCYIVIPALLAYFCVVFELAQGEKTEEIPFGIMAGLAVDLVIFALSKLVKKLMHKNEICQRRS